MFKQARQGDVFWKKIDSLPKDLLGEPVKPDENGMLTLLEGEASNHCHALPAHKDVQAFFAKDVPEGITKMYVVIKEPTEFYHYNNKTLEYTFDHDMLAFTEPGVYEVKSQRMGQLRSILPVVD